ncbi:MAG: response regulator transcription factor [Archangiaceae bacterium]|nr:response regulator transcription factor [Archangiaceae bacterium]
MQKGPILIVDDDPNLREVVRVALELQHFEIVEASDGKAGVEAFQKHHPIAVVLDLMMPELDGFEVCRRIRATSRVPIVFLSSRDDELDRVLGLELGGDDYVTKPFSPRELVARVKAVLRRAEPVSAPAAADETKKERTLSRGPLSLDFEAWRAFWNGAEVTLTVMEFNLLAALLRAPTKAFSRDELIDRAYEGVVVSDRTVDSHIRRVRQKFAAVGGTVVETVHGIGYRLGLP